MDNNFLSPKCLPNNLDRYIVRRSILQALKSVEDKLEGYLLDVGCGDMPYKSLLTSSKSKIVKYVGLDFEVNPIRNNSPDIVWHDGKIPIDSNCVDCAISTEVFEHCPDPESVMSEIFRVLKPGGMLFFTTPFLWPLHEVPYDQYRYTPFSLERHLESSGFIGVELKALGGWDASLAQMLGLWVRRRSMGRYKRKLLSYLLWPIICVLARRDSGGYREFKESSMITGLMGVAFKSE